MAIFPIIMIQCHDINICHSKWVRPQHRTGSLYSSSLQGVNWPLQWPVLGLWRRARGTSTWVELGDWTETNTFLFTDIFKNSYNASQIISKIAHKGLRWFK